MDRTKMAKQLRIIAIPILIIFNIYGAFLEKTFGVSRQLFLLIPLALFLASMIVNMKIKIDKRMFILWAAMMVICLFQLIFFRNYFGIFQTMLYGVVFLLMGINYDRFDLELVSYSIVGVSIVMMIEAIVHYFRLRSWGWATHNVRYFTLAPKEDYTLLLSLAFIILLVIAMDSKLKVWQRCAAGVLMLAELLVNVVIIQSKTAMLLPVFVVVFLYFLSSKKVQRMLRIVCIVAIAAIILLLLVGGSFIPDYVYVFINKYTGLFESKISAMSDPSLFSGTYDQRGSIYAFCWSLFVQQPLTGVGFGNIGNVTKQSTDILVSELTQAESGVISSFVEGGVLFGVLYCVILLIPVLDCMLAGKKAKHDRSTYLKCLLAIALIVCCVANDCKSVTFWLLLGVLCAHGPHTEKKIVWARKEKQNEQNSDKQG